MGLIEASKHLSVALRAVAFGVVGSGRRVAPRAAQPVFYLVHPALDFVRGGQQAFQVRRETSFFRFSEDYSVGF
jgi:hypothetical protein